VDAWALLEARWPFARELAEITSINKRFRIDGDTAFDENLRPVFFVGDLAGSPDFLSIGLKLGRNLDSTAGFADEKAALAGTFDGYRRSRESYFLSPSLNTRHYWPLAKVTAALLGQSRPAALGAWLQDHVVQAELLPFFARSSGLAVDDFIEVRKTSSGGQLADQVLRVLLEARPWTAIVTRYRQTYDVFSRVADVIEAADGPVVRLGGRDIPVVRIDGRNVSGADVDAIAARFRRKGGARPHSSGRASAAASSVAVTTTGAAITFLSEEALGLRNKSGRRWAVAQAFAFGATPRESIARAREFDRARCAELGRALAPDIEADWRDLENPSGWYATHFRQLGWRAELSTGRWTVSLP
jgi:hypothetical protein